MDIQSYKFLDILTDYLAQGIVPKLYCKNIEIIRNMFLLLNMKNNFKNYVIDEFDKKNTTKILILKNSVQGTCNRIRGEAEYFSLYNKASGQAINFCIGPYEYPIVKLSC